VTAIRTAPSPFAQVPGQGLQRPGIDQDKLAAQRAIFAQLTGQTAPTSATTVAAPARAVEPAVAVQQAAPLQRRPTETPAGQPTKYLRPGSILDIRV
jgi:hypothetical protein